MQDLVSALLLVVYVSALVVAAGTFPNSRVRATLYSLPLPMSGVILSTGMAVGSQQVLGVGLLTLFFFLSYLATRRLGPWLGVASGLAGYLIAGTMLASWDPQPFMAVLAVAILAWLALAAWTALGRGLGGFPRVMELGLVRVLVIVAGASLGVGLANALAGFLVTFPFAGVVVALDNRESLKSFAMNFAVFGAPGLLAFVAAVHFGMQYGPTWFAILLGLIAWCLITPPLNMLSRRRNMTALRAIATAIGADPGCRGIAALQNDEARARALQNAVSALGAARTVTLVTGFPIPTTKPPRSETDGPPGTLALAEYLARSGGRVTILTDPVSLPVVCGAAAAVGSNVPIKALNSASEVRVWGQSHRPDIVVFVERPGPTADGTYRSMSAVEIPDVVPLESLVGKDGTIAVGDGGNEVGMGSVLPAVREHISHGSAIACSTTADHLLVAGTSNWGALGLVAALSSAKDRPQTPVELSLGFSRAAVRGCIDGGGIDGVTRLPQETVDGLTPECYEAVLRQLASITAAWR